MINLWKETIEDLKGLDLTWDDVLYVQSHDYQITKENFERIAKDTYFNTESEVQEIDPYLVLIGKDWYMKRRECEGVEWWDIQKVPKLIPNIVEITSLKNEEM